MWPETNVRSDCASRCELTSEQIEAERAEFEAWYFERYRWASFERSSYDGEYLNPAVYHAWHGCLGRAEREHASQKTG